MRHVSFDIETTGVSPANSEIVSIAFVKDKRASDNTRKQVLLNHNDDEESVVEVFVHEMQNLDKNSKIVTYNGTTFDWPFLIARSMEFDDYGDLTDELFKLKAKHGYDLFKDFGRDRAGNYLKLEELLRRNGISHDVECDGSKVPSLFEEEKWEEIREYAKEDAVKTHKLFKELQPRIEDE